MLHLVVALMLAPTVPLPPNPQEVTASGCLVRQVKGAERENYWWHVLAYADFKDKPRWSALFAIRPGTDRRKAMDDCEFYLKKLEKARKQK